MDKQFYKECKVIEINAEDKTLTVIASDETIDRYHEILMAKGCKHGDYIPFLWAHNRAEILPPIGRVMSVNKRNNRVKVKVQFANTEFADSINKLYISDPPMLEKVSVGFITEKSRDPTEDESKKGIRRIIEQWELLEVSAVPVPANPNAGIEKEMRTRIKDAVDSGEIHLPEMVYKDFGFEDAEEEPIETEETEKDIPSLEEKPYPGEHACRLNDPGKYVKFNRKNCEQKHDDKCIDVIYGRKKDGKSEIQSLRYKTDIWKEATAKTHCKSREGTFEDAKKDIKAKIFNCECIKCGHKLKSEKHCNTIKCPKCGGKMRRVERPGPGKESEESEITTLTNEQVKQVQSIFTNMVKEMREEQEPEKDYIKIVEPTITLKDNSQETVEPEKLEESEDAGELAKEMAKTLIDSFLGDFRRDVLGIVDDK